MEKLLINYRPGQWNRMCRTINDIERAWLAKHSTASMKLEDNGDLSVYAIFKGAQEANSTEYLLRFGPFDIPDKWGTFK